MMRAIHLIPLLALPLSACSAKMWDPHINPAELVSGPLERLPCPAKAELGVQRLPDGTVIKQWCITKRSKSYIAHGPWLEWHANGKLKAAGNMSHGERDGPWKTWYWNSALETDGIYVDGWIEGPFITYYSNGQKMTEGWYRQGLLDGPYTTWYKNGQKKFEGSYQEGAEHGRFVNLLANGKVASEIIYEHGELVSLPAEEPSQAQ